MPLFDPTFYTNEQQDNFVKEDYKPVENNNIIWAILIILFGIVSIVALMYVPA